MSSQATFPAIFADFKSAIKNGETVDEFDEKLVEKYGLTEGSAKSRRSTLMREFHNITTEFEHPETGEILNGEQLRVKLKCSRKDVHNVAEENGWQVAKVGQNLKPLAGSGKRGRQVQAVDVSELLGEIDDDMLDA